MSGDVTVLVLALIVTLLAMVAAMVRFSAALVAREPDSRARWGWGAFYVITWAGIVLVFASLPPDSRGHTVPPSVLLLAPAGWATFNAFWLRAWIALGRASGGGRQGLPPDADLLARRSMMAFRLGVVIVSLTLWQLGVPERVAAPMIQPGNGAPSIAIIVGIVGFALFIAGAVRLALGVSQRKSDTEEPTPLGFGQSASGQVEFTFDELRDAWRTGSWRRDRRFQWVFMMVAGAAGAVGGGLAAAWVLGSETTRFVLGGALAYGAVLAWLGIRRGRIARRGGRDS